MTIVRLVLTVLPVSLMLMDAGVVCGQSYPGKPIRIVTGGIGGATDFTSRVVAQGISGPMGQPVIVDSRSSGIIPGQIVSKAPPDGYTLLLHASSVWLSSFMQDDVPYDPLRDFAPITVATIAPNVLVVHPSLPVKSVKDLIALAKARPRELNYGASGAASSPGLAAELFKAMAGVDIVRISYKGIGQVFSDLISGQVQISFPGAAGAVPYVKSGRLKALAVTSAEPYALLPGLATVAATGLPGYEYSAANGVFAPARTPDAIIRRLNQEIVRFLKTAQAREQFLNAGSEVVGSSPEQLTARMQSDMSRLGKMIKDLGIRGE